MRRSQTRDAAALLIHHQHRASAAGPGAGAAISAASCGGAWMLRANRMTPHGGLARNSRSLVGCQRQSGDPNDGGFQKSATEQFSSLAAQPLTERRRLRRVGKATGAHPPQRVAVMVDLAESGLDAGRAGQACAWTDDPTRPSQPPRNARRRAGPSAPLAAGAAIGCLSGATAGFAATGLGGAVGHSRHGRRSRA